MTTPSTSTYITGPSQPYYQAVVGSLRRDRVQGLTLGQYALYDETVGDNVWHYVVMAMGAAMSVVVHDTMDLADAVAYITDDPDDLLA